MRIPCRLAELAIAAFAVAGAAGRAHGEPAADPQIARADELFTEAKALLASNLIQACDKFTESLHYNPAAIGTLLNVALCDEKLGRVASAVARFTEARDHAKEQGLPEHLRAAEDHLATLLPSVPHLAIQLSQPLPDTTVLVDDRVVAPGSLADIAIDPGERVVVVSAPDHLPYRTKLVIARAERRTLVVPALARSVTVTSSWRRIGQITTGTGVVGFGVSVGLAIYGKRLRDRQIDEKHCTINGGGTYSCDPVGQPLIDRARTYGNTATVVGGIGLALAALGAGLWIFAPSGSHDEAGKLAIVPELTGDGASVVALGRF